MPYKSDAVPVAKAFYARVRAATVCQRCGAQPVEWHNPDHDGRTNRRVCSLVAKGYPVDEIQREMDASTPLCRSCHMDVDGRAARLTGNRPCKKGDVQPEKPCVNCEKLSRPTWQGRCRLCYDWWRRHGHQERAIK